MRWTPSVSVQQTTPGQGTIYVRGLSGRAVVYSVDGVRLNTAFFRSGNNDYLGLLDPYAVHEITVVPGATSVEYGSDALGGAVLMTTKTPEYRLDGPATTYNVLQGLSSNPVSTNSRVSMLHESKNWGIHTGITYYQAGAIRPGGGLSSPDPGSYAGLDRAPDGVYAPRLVQNQIGTEFEQYAGDLAIRGRLARGTHLIARAQVSVRPELLRYDQVTPRFKRTEPQRAEAGLRPMSRHMVSLALERNMSNSFFDSALALVAWQRISEHRCQRNYEEQCVVGNVVDPLSDTGCAGRVRLVPEMTRSGEDNVSDTFSARAEVRSTGRIMSLILGVDARHDRIRSSAEVENLLTHVTQADESRYPSGSSLSEGGIFAHARMKVVDRFHLFGGARAGAFLLDVPSRDAAGSSPVSQGLADVAASFGAHWEFAPHIAWVANAARGVRSPNVEDLAALGTRAQGRFQVPNPALGPEHSYTADTGLKLFNSSARMQSFVFYTRYEDAIILSPTTVGGAAATPDGDAYYHSTNASSVELYGAESNLDVDLVGPIGTFARALVMLGIQKNPPQNDVPEVTPADRVPPAQGELGLRAKLGGQLQIEACAAGRAAQRRLNDPVNIDDNRIPEHGTPAYVTYHARFRYTASPLIARLSVDNISDAVVLEHGSGFHRPGFSVMGSVELRFGDST
jgi:outer membrane receptor protein involved in Fe transport